jgi:hypothetical protein
VEASRIIFLFWKQRLGKGKGRLELGVGGEQCGHRKVNEAEGNAQAENPKVK